MQPLLERENPLVAEARALEIGHVILVAEVSAGRRQGE
jgi:hypothetical protein